ncbi:MAG: PEP/pyruvate-binding domain-containing protein [Candidatus Thorarchaeota archaeon SMTZ1-83]|nr:MAG: hypothetical protein AM324_01735 [Candidatus Thorarchaeota archaeon SMTZ1-83]
MDQAISIIPLFQITKHTNAGTKAYNLSLLKKMGYAVPETFVIPFESFDEYSADNDVGMLNMSRLLRGVLDENKHYSVRSSANVEDSSLYSFAGQFETQLNVRGLESVTEAVKRTWDSARGESAAAYKSGLGHAGPHLKMAVLIQEMVKPEFSGVVFTRNPITGLDEAIVETVDGYGDALVQGGVTPERWVYKWENWIDCPSARESRKQTVLSVIEAAKKIAAAVGSPIDLEWAYDGERIVWLQLREITTLRNTNIYSNRISREFLPGIILPLVWSVNIPVVNTSWKRLFTEMIGKKAETIDIDSLAKSFYYRAYFNMGIVGDIFEMLGMPREALEILAGIETVEEGRPVFRPGPRTLRYLPRMLLAALRKLFFSKNIEIFLRNRKTAYQEAAALDTASLDESKILGVIDSLFELNTDSSYYVIVSQLLNSLYNMMLRSQLEKRGISFDRVRFVETSERLSPIDPKQQLERLREEYDSLDSTRQELLIGMTWMQAIGTDELGSFGELLGRFVQRFGHLSDSGNDFSKPTWREDPTLIMRMVADHVSTSSVPEYNEGQTRLAAALEESGILRMIYNRAARYHEYRESVNHLYTYGYGLFRRFFQRLEGLLIQRGYLQHKDDIFYLTYDEVKLILDDPSRADHLRKVILERREEVQRYRDVSLPEVIYNELPETALFKGKVLRNLEGVATSRGHYIGPTRVVNGPSDFDKIQVGDVLVIPYSDVSWTPLFSKAAAVVSESGGILSHCSIVAREYGIPAVVSVSGAMSLKDDILVAVDGYNGEVQIMED